MAEITGFLGELKALAVSAGIPATSITLSSWSMIPETDEPHLALVQTPGAGFARTQNDTATEYATAQASVRAASPTAAAAMLKTFFDACGGANGRYNFTLEGTQYVSLRARSNIGEIGLDASSRSTWVFNIDAEKAPS